MPDMYPFEMEHICTYTATLDPDLEVIGPTPEGLRVNVYVTGGEAKGPKINGHIRPVGGDWLTIRPDGVGILDVRATLETHDGALIYVAYQGVAEMGEEGYQNFLDGKPELNPPLRCAPRLSTSHPDYLWVNRLQFILIGEADLTAPYARYDMYALK